MARLTVQELAERTGETVESLEGWRDAGLLPAGARFGFDDAERVRLIRFLLRRGFDLDTITRAERHREGLLDGFLDLLFPSGHVPSSTLAEIAATATLPLPTARRLWEAAGFDEREAVGDDDVAMITGFKIALEAGLPEPALVELVRVYADALRRVAEAEVRVFHFQVQERLRAAGVRPDEVRQAVDTASEQRAPTPPRVARRSRACSSRTWTAKSTPARSGSCPLIWRTAGGVASRSRPTPRSNRLSAGSVIRPSPSNACAPSPFDSLPVTAPVPDGRAVAPHRRGRARPGARPREAVTVLGLPNVCREHDEASTTREATRRVRPIVEVGGR